ncbi:MAG: 4-alpha-glucanotransferase [Phycisphaerae bacterium]|nr:4-alpha-glucanotransferase [Phycisphaerae bacterium]
MSDELAPARTSGVLLHLTSLPGAWGGDAGPQAHALAARLARAGQSWWQMLPISPPGPGMSPYASSSSFAGSPWLVSLELLRREGWLSRDEVPVEAARGWRIEFKAAQQARRGALRRAFERWRTAGGQESEAFGAFCRRHSEWLDDFALFSVLRAAHGGRPWNTWDAPLRRRRAAALRAVVRTRDAALSFVRFVQFVFDQQWTALRAHCRRLGVGLIGDVPIFVAHDSADVWANPSLFRLDRGGRPSVVSGCPPDSFNPDGQHWGHPHYAWGAHERSGFEWWVRRVRAVMERFDLVRIDHFIGLHRTWQVPGRAKTARRGRWGPSPGAALLSALRRGLGGLPFIAEDLGLLTREAAALRDRFGLPGMRVLQFGFDGSDAGRYHLPERFSPRCVAYTGTHDNPTTVGWWHELRRGGDVERRRFVLRYLGVGGKELHWGMIRALCASCAGMVILPMQDMLGLDDRHRMNTPGKARGNWAWQMSAAARLQPALDRLGRMTADYGRLGRG